MEGAMTEIVLEREAAIKPSRALSRRVRKALAVAALLLAAGMALADYGYNWWTVGRWQESTDDAYVGGNVTAISPHVAGFVREILVADNEHVRKGQLLIRLDPRNYQAALDRADAIVRQREATLGSLRAQSALQQSSIQQAEAGLAATIAEASFASEDAKRYRQLATLNAGSRQLEQKAIASNRKAQAAVTSSEAELAAARQQLAVLDAKISEAAAAVAEANADRETARLDFGYTEIRSPIDGYVGNRAARVGAYASVGTYLVSIIPAHDLWVDANFKEDQLARMKPGQRVTIVADILPGHALEGRVVSLARATGATFSIIPAENATGNFTKIVQRVPVRIVLEPGGDGLESLRPGLSTTVTVDTRTD
jgi:membrane fusion protein, multidrug efflux system